MLTATSIKAESSIDAYESAESSFAHLYEDDIACTYIRDSWATCETGHRNKVLIVKVSIASNAENTMRLFIPYRGPESEKGFGIRKPHIIAVDDVDQSETDLLIASFLSGMKTNAQAESIWQTCYEDIPEEQDER